MTTQGPHQGMPAQPAGHPQQVPINDQVANLKHLVGQLKECFSVSFFDLRVSVLILFFCDRCSTKPWQAIFNIIPKSILECEYIKCL